MPNEKHKFETLQMCVGQEHADPTTIHVSASYVFHDAHMRQTALMQCLQATD